MESIKKYRYWFLGGAVLLLVVLFVSLASCNTKEFEQSITLNRWEYTVKNPTYDKDTNAITFDFFRKSAENKIEVAAPDYTFLLEDAELEVRTKDVREEYGISMNHSESKDGNKYYYVHRITIEDLPYQFEYISILCELPPGYIAPEYLENADNPERLTDEEKQQFNEEIRIYKKDCK